MVAASAARVRRSRRDSSALSMSVRAAASRLRCSTTRFSSARLCSAAWYVGGEPFGLFHQFERAVFRLADPGLAVVDLFLKGAVLLVGFRVEHLVLQF